MREIIMQTYQQISEKVDALSIRERALVCVTSLVMMYSVWDAFFYTMVFGSNEEIIKSASQLKGQIESLKSQLGSLSEVISSDPYHDLKDKASIIKRESAHFEQQIKVLTKQLIPPQKMSQLLSNILAEDQAVTLLRLENVPEEPLFKESNKNANEAHSIDRFQVYKHGLIIEFSGTYFNIKDFIQQLEKLPWKLIWDDLDYQVESYPTAKVTLTVYTLSLNEGWIGA